jgi:hypothetical protein
MGPEEDPHDDGQLEQRDKREPEQRVLERGDHALGARCVERGMLPDASVSSRADSPRGPRAAYSALMFASFTTTPHLA